MDQQEYRFPEGRAFGNLSSAHSGTRREQLGAEGTNTGGTMPNMFFMLRVTPDQWWVLILGIETMKSASSQTKRIGNPK